MRSRGPDGGDGKVVDQQDVDLGDGGKTLAEAALFEEGGFNLVAPQRPKNPDYDRYVDSLESFVRRLLDAGVKPSRITLVGFSRGGQLTASVSSRLAREGINTAILAICENGDFIRDPPLILGGNFLSIYETSDVVGSCANLAARSHLSSFKEIAISTGRRHGAFFQPAAGLAASLEGMDRGHEPLGC